MFDLCTEREAKITTFMCGLGMEPEVQVESWTKRRVTPQKATLKKYNLSSEQFDELLARQGGHCAICPSTEALCIDHDHACCPGKSSCGQCVRGILCIRCNWMLGWIQDDVARLRAAVAYLGR